MEIENAFIGKREKPTPAQVAEVLAASAEVWQQLVEALAKEQGVTEQEWKSSSVKYGWSLRLKQKKRTIVYLSPCKDHFLVSFALGEKAIKAARQSDLPKKVLRVLAEAPRYSEGTGIRLTVKEPKDLNAIQRLVAIKLAN